MKELGNSYFKDEKEANHLLNFIKNSFETRSIVQHYVAGIVFDRIGEFIESVKNKEDGMVTDKEYQLLNSPIDKLVSHIISEYVGGKVFINSEVLDTNLNHKEKDNLLKSMIVRKRGGGVGLREKAPPISIFNKNLEVSPKFVKDGNDMIFIKKNGLFFKGEEGSVLSTVLIKSVANYAKNNQVDSFFYTKDEKGNIDIKHKSGFFETNLLKYQMAREGDKFLSTIIPKIENIINLLSVDHNKVLEVNKRPKNKM